ncbi:hypothetical protein CI1B_39090 [Bradyrhizobium ivorense]|uniref:Flp/Fap pilin component n=1 Tax=Bradyrhizobium ivorense TaxID=2511166 RepID=A0A508T9Q5_9BRAD|nr:hypothetical protein [Bradyrhizobium ivorense]VIO72265.1 hypothetical protein CI1B_39090 [Bradyrhizobium ivorense]
MSKFYVSTMESLKRLRADKDGVVSFEYIIVAACIVAVVLAVFKTDTSISTALSNGITKISSTFSGL